MDSTISARAAAGALGVPDATVLRWCREGLVLAHKDGRGRWRLTRAAVDARVAEHGAVPVPHPPGRTRPELLILTALTRAPRGLPSARAVATAASLAPTTASKVLDRLADDGMAQERRENRLVRGRSRAMSVWYADLDSPKVRALLPYLHRVVLPEVPAPRVDRLPDHLWHLFWNADPAEIVPRRDAALVAHRAITTGDPEAIAWAVHCLPASAFEEALGYRGTPADAVAWLRAAQASQRTDAAA